MLAQIARELVTVMRRDMRTDWTRRPEVQAKLRTVVRRLLRKYNYPPDKQPEPRRKFGGMTFDVPDDFDAPLDEEELGAWE